MDGAITYGDKQGKFHWLSLWEVALTCWTLRAVGLVLVAVKDMLMARHKRAVPGTFLEQPFCPDFRSFFVSHLLLR